MIRVTDDSCDWNYVATDPCNGLKLISRRASARNNDKVVPLARLPGQASTINTLNDKWVATKGEILSRYSVLPMKQTRLKIFDKAAKLFIQGKPNSVQSSMRS